MRMTGIVIGILAVIAGIVWTLQGLNILGGSFMSGQTMYAVIGPIVAAVGVALVAFSARRRSA